MPRPAPTPRPEFAFIRAPNNKDFEDAAGNRLGRGEWAGGAREIFLRAAAVDKARMRAFGDKVEMVRSWLGGQVEARGGDQDSAARLARGAVERGVRVRFLDVEEPPAEAKGASRARRVLRFVPDPPLDPARLAEMARGVEGSEIEPARGEPWSDPKEVTREVAPGDALVLEVLERRLRLALGLVGAWDDLAWDAPGGPLVLLRRGSPIALLSRDDTVIFKAPAAAAPPAPLEPAPWVAPPRRGPATAVADLPRALVPGAARAAWRVEGTAGGAVWSAAVLWSARGGLSAVGRQRGRRGQWVVAVGEEAPSPVPWAEFEAALRARGGPVAVARAEVLWQAAAAGGPAFRWRDAAAALGGRPAAVAMDPLALLHGRGEEAGPLDGFLREGIYLDRVGGVACVAVDERLWPLDLWAEGWRRKVGAEPEFVGLWHGEGPRHHYLMGEPPGTPAPRGGAGRVALRSLWSWVEDRGWGPCAEGLPRLARVFGPGAFFRAESYGPASRGGRTHRWTTHWEIAVDGSLWRHARPLYKLYAARPGWPVTVPVDHAVEPFEEWLRREGAERDEVDEARPLARAVPVDPREARRPPGPDDAAPPPDVTIWPVPEQPDAPAGARYAPLRAFAGAAPAVYDHQESRFLRGAFADEAAAAAAAARLNGARALADAVRPRDIW